MNSVEDWLVRANHSSGDLASWAEVDRGRRQPRPTPFNQDGASMKFDDELLFEEEQPDEYGSFWLTDWPVVSDYIHCWGRGASLELSLRIRDRSPLVREDAQKELERKRRTIIRSIGTREANCPKAKIWSIPLRAFIWWRGRRGFRILMKRTPSTGWWEQDWMHLSPMLYPPPLLASLFFLSTSWFE